VAVAIVTVAGRTYRIGCEEGQQKRLEELAALLEGKIEAMRKNFGEIGDQRIVVMAALEIADEGADARARNAALEADVARAREETAQAQRREAAAAAGVADTLSGAAARLVRLTQTISRRDEGVDLP